MELFPYVDNVYIDILDNCMSDVHCHIGLVISCKPIVYIQHKNVMHIESKHVMDKRSICNNVDMWCENTGLLVCCVVPCRLLGFLTYNCSHHLGSLRKKSG